MKVKIPPLLKNMFILLQNMSKMIFNNQKREMKRFSSTFKDLSQYQEFVEANDVADTITKSWSKRSS